MVEQMAKYSFCEPTTAGPMAPWHIRRIGGGGQKFGGGVDTASLCGRVDPAKLGGWDVRVPVDGYPLDRLVDGRRLVCAECVNAYRREVANG